MSKLPDDVMLFIKCFVDTVEIAMSGEQVRKVLSEQMPDYDARKITQEYYGGYGLDSLRLDVEEQELLQSEYAKRLLKKYGGLE